MNFLVNRILICGFREVINTQCTPEFWEGDWRANLEIFESFESLVFLLFSHSYLTKEFLFQLLDSYEDYE